MDIKSLYASIGGEIKEFEKFGGKVEEGYSFSYKKKITEADIQLFGLISGDLSPIHFDEEIASKTKFKGRVVHGMLTISLVSAAIARIPGLVVILESYFKYISPVRVNDEVIVEGIITEAHTKSKYKIEIVCKVAEREVVKGWVKAVIW